jgi:hypothetical protein
MRVLALVISSLALIYAAPAVPARGAEPGLSAASPATDFSSAKRRKRSHRVEPVLRYRHGPGTIACTRAGCQAIAPGCHAIRQRGFDDTPTGFQIIVC